MFTVVDQERKSKLDDDWHWNRPKRLSVRRARSRTAAGGVCSLDVNQNPSQPHKCIQFMPHKAPELAKLQAASNVGVR